MRGLALLLLALALAPAASAQAPPCPPGEAPSATILARDSFDGGGSLTATHPIELEVEPETIGEFFFSSPVGIRETDTGSELRVDAPGSVPVTATWEHYIYAADSFCTASTQSTFNIEPAKPPGLVPPPRKPRIFTQLEWFLHFPKKDADVRPVEVRIRSVRRARVPGASAPLKRIRFAFREGDKGVRGRARPVRSGRWSFEAGYLHGRPRILMFESRNGPFGVELEFVQGGRRIGRTRIVGRCGSIVCEYRTVPAAPAAKKKPKKCKKGQVRAKVGKRRTCIALKKAFPKPRAGDVRSLVTQSVVGQDWSHLRTRRGKRLPSLPKLIRKVGPGAPALLTKAIRRGLKRIDGFGPRASAAAQGSGGCGNASQAPRQSDRFTTGGGGGSSASVGVQVGPDGASMGIELSGNELTIKADIDLGLCEPNEVEAPDCPTAVGRVQGKIRYKLKVAVQIQRGQEEVWSQAIEVQRRTELDGWNEVDAKLDRLDIEDVEASNASLGGTSRAYPPISIRTRITRRTQVDMRTGSYDPGRSQVDVRIDTEGLSGPDRSDAEGEAERKAQTDADRQFRTVIEKAISGYRRREQGWQEPPKCASLKFNPTSNTLTLRGGASGSFTATAIAKADGNPSELDARLTSMEHAQFSPTRAGGQRAQFSYSNVVSAAAPGAKVRAKVRATSKAGVAEDTWEQNLQPPFEINRIAGNFSGTYTQPVGPRTARVTWNGGATFTRTGWPAGTPGAVGTYVLTAGHATFHYSGGNILGHALCDMRGTASIDLVQHGGGSLTVFPVGANPFEQGPHDYGGEVATGPTAEVTLTMENCVPEAESEEGKQYTIPVGFPALITGAAVNRSPDGIHYEGSSSRSEGGITTEWSWTFTGEKASP
jgi:hypothetical protein